MMNNSLKSSTSQHMHQNDVELIHNVSLPKLDLKEVKGEEHEAEPISARHSNR
jgi:hypothetical protein